MPITSPGNDDDTGENHQPTLRKNTAEPVEQTLKQNRSYLANAPEEDLASWLHTHLGEQDARMGFSYSDVLADCDAWLLARSMQSDSSERSLSTAMRDMFAQSETNRIKRFYQSRFKGSADNLVIAFRKLVDGIDLGIFDNVSGSKKALLIASHADRLPSQAEAGILALSYAESLENPNR